MKIGINQLDKDITDKLLKVEEILNGNGLVHIDSDNNIVHKRINDLKLREIFKLSDLERIYNNKNSFRATESLMVGLTEPTPNFSNLVLKSEVDEVLNGDVKIISFKKINHLLILNYEDGNTIVYNLNKNKIVYTGDIINIIKTSLAVNNLRSHHILYVIPHGDGILISTKNDGVLYYNIREKTIERKFPDNNVLFMQSVRDDVLLISSDISEYSFETGYRKAKDISIAKLNSNPIDVLSTDKYIIILTDSTTNPIFVLEKTEFGEYNNITNYLWNHSNDIRYNKMNIFNKELYLYSENVVRKYKLNDLTLEYEIINENIKHMDTHSVYINNNILEITDGDITHRRLLNINYSDLFIDNNKIWFIGDYGLFNIDLHLKESKVNLFNFEYTSPIGTNSTTIVIESRERIDKIVLIDMEDGKEYKYTNAVHVNRYNIFNVFGLIPNKTKMILEVRDGNELFDLVVLNDTIFIK